MRDQERERIWTRTTLRVGEFLRSLGEGVDRPGLPGGVMTGFVVRMPTEKRPDCLIVVRATGKEGRVVAFVGGLDLTQAILTWRAKYLGPGLKYREDRPYESG